MLFLVSLVCKVFGYTHICMLQDIRRSAERKIPTIYIEIRFNQVRNKEHTHWANSKQPPNMTIIVFKFLLLIQQRILLFVFITVFMPYQNGSKQKTSKIFSFAKRKNHNSDSTLDLLGSIFSVHIKCKLGTKKNPYKSRQIISIKHFSLSFFSLSLIHKFKRQRQYQMRRKKVFSFQNELYSSQDQMNGKISHSDFIR